MVRVLEVAMAMAMAIAMETATAPAAHSMNTGRRRAMKVSRYCGYQLLSRRWRGDECLLLRWRGSRHARSFGPLSSESRRRLWGLWRTAVFEANDRAWVAAARIRKATRKL